MGDLVRLPQVQSLSWDDCRLLVESVEDYAIFMLDVDGYVATWSSGAQRIKGYRREEIVGQHFSVFYPAADNARGKPARELEEARAHGRVEDEGWRVRKDGSLFWANVVITALRGNDGALRGFAKVTRDLSARRASEEALRRSEERLRLLIESVVDYAIYVLDPQGNVQTWNAGAERLTGYRADEIIGKNFRLFFPEEDARAGKPEQELAVAHACGRFEEEGFRIRKGGEKFWAHVVVTPILDARGELISYAKVTRDLSQRIAAEQTARELVREQAAREAAEAAEARLREGEERYRALSRRLQVILEGVADGITVQERSGRVVFANSAAAHASGYASVSEFQSATPEEITSRFELLDELGRPLGPDEFPGRRVLRGEESASLLMHVREKATGRAWWSMVRATGVRGPDGAPDIAVNIWHDVTAARRRELHERYLARATAALSASLDYSTMLSALAAQLVPELADWCTIHMLEGSKLELVGVAHADPAKLALARELGDKYPPSAEHTRGVWNVLRTGTSELYEQISDELLRERAQDEEHLAHLRAAGIRSALIVPVRFRDRVLGALSLVTAGAGRRYGATDLALAEELGRRAGSSVENARLYAAERKARDQLELLARAGESFSGAPDYEAMLRRVVDATMPVLADFAFFDVVEGAEVRRIAAAHADPELDALINQSRWQRSERSDMNLCALSSGAPGFHPFIDHAWRKDVATSPEHLALLERLALGSMITVPLRARDELLGALTLCFGKSGRHHSEGDLWLSEELARRAAIAIVQVRLYARAQEAARVAEEAARRAEQANRVKDEFLATVSHELRTPLNAIVGWSSLLRTRSADPSVTKGVEVIHRNALAQSKIIDDILDVSRIITGKLRLELRMTDLAAVVRDAIEVVRPSAAAKQITIEFAPPKDEYSLVADPERLQQIVWNLLSNAVKFTEAGGRVTASLQRVDTSLRLSVSDTGMGIEPEFLPFVFDRFKQADSSTTRRVGGLGLGLAIVRHLTELHGGRVEATSDGAGRGACFRVTLPVRAVVAPEAAEAAAPDASAPHEQLADGVLAGKRVLVVDDEADARELLQAVLSAAGATVETAGSAAEGLTTLRRFLPDVLVSDIGMPGEDGYSFIKRVKSLDSAEGGGVPSVALTAYTRGQDKTKALAMGFTTHIGKPVNPDDLVAAVANLSALSALRRG